MAIFKLTALQVSQLLKKPGRHRKCDGAGLWLEVNNGNGAWSLRYMRHGRAHQLGLGPLHTVSLAEAREAARTARQVLRAGQDPIEIKRGKALAVKIASVKATTFKQETEAWLALHERKWRSAKHRLQFQNSLVRYAYPIIGDLPMGDIDTQLVLKVIQPLWNEKTVTMDRVRNRIEIVIGAWAARTESDRPNPARWKGHLKNLLPAKGDIVKTKPMSAMPYAELPAFMSKLREVEGEKARALEFLILSAARTGDVAGADWSEIDLKSRVWVIPAARMKAEREHRVPLTEEMIAVLGKPANGAVFGRFGTDGKNLTRVLQRIIGGDKYQVHGFRATFSTWANDRSAFARDVIETALAHAIGNKTERAYRRGDALDKRRALMEAWGKFCYGPSVSGDVLAFGGKRA